MEEVTDFAFREIIARYSGEISNSKSQAPSRNNFVLFTEFVNVDGLLHPEGQKKLLIDLKYSEIQRPIVAQLWGTDPKKFHDAAKFIKKLGFDGIDINMGCPQAKEIAIGACAALIRQPDLAREIIIATKEGAGNIPVSVKTRIGYSKPEEMEEWVATVLETEPAVLILHGRTKKEMSKVPAHWDRVAGAVRLRDKVQGNRDKEGKTLIVGNGDVRSYEEGLERVKETGVDGIMIGRGAFGDPWVFNPKTCQHGAKERLRVMLEHARLFCDTFAGQKHFMVMRKHFKAYASGFDGAHELRAKLMEAGDLEETERIVEEFLSDNL